MSGYAWSWADYEREKRKAERRKDDLERLRPVAAKLSAEATAAEPSQGRPPVAAPAAEPSEADASRPAPEGANEQTECDLDHMVDRLDARLDAAPASPPQTTYDPQGSLTADSASGCEGRAAAVSIPPAEQPATEETSGAVNGEKARQSRTNSNTEVGRGADLDRVHDQTAPPRNRSGTSARARPAPPPPTEGKIDLAAAPSAMEQTARSWASDLQKCDACGKKRRTPCDDGGCPIL